MSQTLVSFNASPLSSPQDCALLLDQQQTLHLSGQCFTRAALQSEADCGADGQLHGTEPHGGKEVSYRLPPKWYPVSLVLYFWPEPWSKLLQCLGNRAPLRTQPGWNSPSSQEHLAGMRITEKQILWRPRDGDGPDHNMKAGTEQDWTGYYWERAKDRERKRDKKKGRGRQKDRQRERERQGNRGRERENGYFKKRTFMKRSDLSRSPGHPRYLPPSPFLVSPLWCAWCTICHEANVKTYHVEQGSGYWPWRCNLEQ